MSIFGAIKHAIFGDNGPLGGGLGGQAATQTEGPAPGRANTAPQAPTQAPPGGGTPVPQGQQPATPASPTPAAPAPAPAPAMDVEKILSDKAAASGQPSNWRTSIVDLLKLLELDSSLEARKQLAAEMGYTGPKDGSAEMNIALHKAVMRNLAGEGATVPAAMTA